MIVGVTVAGAATTLGVGGDLGTIEVSSDLRFYEAIVAGAVVLGSLAAISTDSRFAAVAALGVVGYSTGLIYLFFGAPDLAMLQILVHTLVVVLFAFVFYHLPRFSLLSQSAGRLREAVFCLPAGGLPTGLVLPATDAAPAKPTLPVLCRGQPASNKRRHSWPPVAVCSFKSGPRVSRSTRWAVGRRPSASH